jgi:patatin-related protein
MSDKKIEKEIRFAVVMYGGGSLAIYINGVAQELLKMVRATATDRRAGDKFESTEKVYRRLALLLSDEHLLEMVRALEKPEQIELILDALLEPGESPLKIYRQAEEVRRKSQRTIVAEEKSRKEAEKLEKIWQRATNIKAPAVRFVIDVITGSSAGGINGVFLAKALANNQEISQLKQLWLDEGDFKKLLNDKDSVVDVALKRPTQPASLLNSQRMYLKLLTALDKMGDSAAAKTDKQLDSPNVDELDLFVTVTDFTGVPVPIRLFDRVVTERRHKQHFHFRYGKKGAVNGDINQFTKKYNPFLAFAARSTSAFPLAFEPMRLADIDAVIDRCFPQYQQTDSDWTGFFEDFRLPKHLPANVRYFVDGGALDNKPFGFAIETLLKREADVPVDRKLIYVEPSPDFSNSKDGESKQPDALENLIGQGSTLPRYETIREDLQVLLDRNRLIQRVNRLIKFVERDADVLYKERLDLGSHWENKDFKDIAEDGRVSFLPYYRLRLISLTDSIARSATKFFGFDPESDYFLAIRSLVRRWREQEYPDNKPENTNESGGTAGTKTALYFLRRFDISYRIRRLRLILRKAEQLRQCGDWEPKLSRALLERYPAIHSNCRNDELQIIIGDIQKQISEILQNFRRAQEGLVSFRLPAADSNAAPRTIFAQALTDALNFKSRPELWHLEFILGQRNLKNEPISEDFSEEIGVEKAKEFFEAKPDSHQWLKKLGQALEDYLTHDIFEPLGQQVENLLKPVQGDNELNNSVREYFYHYYANFDDYDQMTFPIFYETHVGEADVVEIVRISPQDASSLINESSDDEKRRKLAGNALYGFGAFLDVRWRQNDIAWGRLDGAERIITSLLPTGDKYKTLREILIRRAHDEILSEEFTCKSRDSLNKEMLGVLLHAKSLGNNEKGDKKAVRRLIDNLIENSALEKEFQDILGSCLKEPNDIYKAVNKQYEVDRRLEPKEALRIASRSTQITGKILEQIAEKNARAGSRMAWIARLGGIFWSFVEVAAPNTLSNLLFRHWLKLLYFFEAFLIIGGTLLGNPQVQQFGLLALLVTITVNLTTLYLHDAMRGRKAWKKTIAAGLIVGGVFFTLVGIFSFVSFFFFQDVWELINAGRGYFVGLPRRIKYLPGILLGGLILLMLFWSGFNERRAEKQFEKDLPQ